MRQALKCPRPEIATSISLAPVMLPSGEKGGGGGLYICDSSKDREMGRSTRIIWTGGGSEHINYKREAEGDVPHTDEKTM